MDLRGGNRWIDLDEKENFKHYYIPGLSDYLNTVQKYLSQKPWWHTYYLDTLRSIHYGLN